MKNTLQNHIKKFGGSGKLSWNAGRDVNDTTNVDIEQLSESHTSTLYGGFVKIVGTEIPLRISQCNGEFLRLESYGDGGFKDFYKIAQKYGTYSYGKIIVNRHNVIKVDDYVDTYISLNH